VIATLISSNRNLGDAGVLYLHGYNDYFHTHVAEKFNENNFDFYALDLRKYGRSLLKISTPIIVKTLKNILKKYQLP
jgi:alpha-beta hydrolase superfamily lysophospholipase